MDEGSSSNVRKADKTEFTDVVGGFGRWQLMICILIYFNLVTSPWHNFIITFYAPNVPHWCARPDEIVSANISLEEWKILGIPSVDNETYDRCKMWEMWNASDAADSNISRSIVPCNKWEYDTSVYSNTLINKWDMVCNRVWMISVLKSIFMGGYLVSGILCGQFADRYGRRLLILCCLSLYLVSCLATAFSSSFTMFTILRFLISLGITGCSSTCYVLGVEFLGPKERVVFCYVRGFIWTFGMMILVGIAWLIRDWFWLQMTLTLPVLLQLSFWWFIPESPRWLLTHGHVDRATKQLELVTKTNKIQIDDIKETMTKLTETLLKDVQGKKDQKTWLDLFRTSNFRKKTLILLFIWSTTLFIYYGISWNTNRLSGDIYLNFFFSSIVEAPGTLIFFFISTRFGRRRSLAISNLSSGFLLLLTLAVPKNSSSLSMAMIMIAKSFIKSAITDAYILSAEIFPTVIRTLGIGFCSGFSRFAAMAASFASYMVIPGYETLPSVLFGVLSTCCGLLVLVLPETRNRHIPDTIEEAKKMDRLFRTTQI